MVLKAEMKSTSLNPGKIMGGQPLPMAWTTTAPSFRLLPNTRDCSTWVPSIAPSGLIIYEGDQFPQWHGDLFVGALVDQEVRRIDLENGEVVGEHAEFPEIKGRIRDIRQAPDGSIYIITDGEAGSILRVSAL
jgi:glucose/arabinose dehydrogenase